MMRIGIIGTGAMGSLLAAHLAPQAEVTVLGTWEQGIRAMQTRGIALERDGETVFVPVHATGNVSDVTGIDLAILAVKAHQTDRAAQWAKHILAPSGSALTLQNGLGNLERLAFQVGAERATIGVTMQGATMIGPAHVRHAGRGLTTLAATRTTRGLVHETAQLLNRVGLETHVAGDVASLVWGKLVVNSAINALTAIYRVPNGWLLENPEARALMMAAAEETAAVASALGIQLPYTDPVSRALQVAAATATNKSSTLQDVLRGAPTELDRINGAVVREGKRVGVPTPVNEKLMRVIENPRFPRHQVATVA